MFRADGQSCCIHCSRGQSRNGRISGEAPVRVGFFVFISRLVIVQGEKKGRADPLPFSWITNFSAYFLLTAFFSSAPGENFATLRAAILIVAPVCGLRPFRAFLCEIEKVPKPIKATRSPLRSAPVMLLTVVSIAVVACALLISQAPAILSTRSALFMCFSSQVSFIPSTHREDKGSWLSWETRREVFSSLRVECQL